MTTTKPWGRFLLIAGFLAMLIGAIDPMEGSLLILPGSALVALGTILNNQQRSFIFYRLWSFFLITVGVGVLWITSVLGGIGGESAYSMWWGLLYLPYPIGWSMAMWGPDSPRWVLWSGIVLGGWFVVMMLLAIKMSANFDEPASVLIFVGFIGAIGLITIAGCIYRLRRIKSATPS
ncbi:MAG: hypothetical protein KJN89_00725 [Gammaproteobacteria bacterium]|nr:hypothetical protein [Gammaproteobacteria bacterium]NNJ48864.1 hypothetical protein [Gammaproteobacteria bacterium]